MSICHGIVGSLGGSIKVESEAGKGALFRVTLSAAKLSEAVKEASPEPKRQGSKGAAGFWSWTTTEPWGMCSSRCWGLSTR